MGETKGKAFKNQSMLEDNRLNSVEKVQKRFRVKYVDTCGSPIGHLYSFMLE